MRTGDCPAAISSACAPRQHDRDERRTSVQVSGNEMSKDVQEDTASGPDRLDQP
jgi:hypothetical protein